MPRPLGEKQIGTLRSLEEHGGWEPGCGWIWDTHSNTQRIMDTLVKRGLATKLKRGAYRVTPAGRKENQNQREIARCVRLFG